MASKVFGQPELPVTLIDMLNKVSIFQTAAFTEASLKNLVVDTKLSTSYGDFNLGLHVKDDPKSVLANRMQLLSAINQTLSEHNKPLINRLFWLNQVHGNRVFQVKNAQLGMTPPNADAQISDLAGVGLAIMTADCVPIVLYQPASNKIAAIHAGWQGLACGVIQQTVNLLDNAPILAWIGVAISQDNYEVSKDVLAKLKTACQNEQLLTDDNLASFDERYSKKTSAKKISADKVNINLPKLAVDQLTAQGVTVQSAATACSYGDAKFYSYRRQSHQNQIATGRMALVIVRHD